MLAFPGAPGFLIFVPIQFRSRKEVNGMKYSKPEITQIAEASAAIRLDNSLTKSVSGADLSNPHQMTAPAYSVADDD